jgi:succinate dehydrogenase flavin-adding protein (antitoxin of CptAB toxin-antitoxin module)
MNRAQRVADALTRSRTDRGEPKSAARLAWYCRQEGANENDLREYLHSAVSGGRVKDEVTEFEGFLADSA